VCHRSVIVPVRWRGPMVFAVGWAASGFCGAVLVDSLPPCSEGTPPSISEPTGPMDLVDDAVIPCASLPRIRKLHAIAFTELMVDQAGKPSSLL